MPELAVIIVNYNTRDLLRTCLTQLMRRVSGWDAHTVVVDNASSDGSVDLVRRDFPEVSLLVNSENLGFARANNRAVEATDSRYVLLLNTDAFLHRGALDELRRVLDGDDRIAVAGPRMYDAGGAPLASAHSLESLSRCAATAIGIHQFLPKALMQRAARVVGRAGMLHRVNYEASTVTDVDWVSGACMMVRRSAAADVGSLDDRFFMYMEDEDWCRRFGEAGYRVVYVPTAGVTHHIGKSSASSSTMAKLYRDSRLIYHKKHNARHYLIYWMLSHLYAARQCAHSGLSGLLTRRSRSAVCSAYSQEG